MSNLFKRILILNAKIDHNLVDSSKLKWKVNFSSTYAMWQFWQSEREKGEGKKESYLGEFL